MLFQFFSVFSANESTSIITSTFSRAASDLVYFFVVYLTTVLLYLLMGQVLFGDSLVEFSSTYKCAQASHPNALCPPPPE